MEQARRFYVRIRMSYLSLGGQRKNKGIVLTRDQILESVWGFDYAGETNVVDVYINYLRNKIDRDKENKLITTARGVGYSIKDED